MKKLLSIVGAVVLLAGGFLTYCYFTPVISIAVSRPVDQNAESYVCRPMLALSEKLGLPLPPSKREQIRDFAEKTDAVDRELHEDYARPVKIDVAVEAAGGRTIVTYTGTVTEKSGGTAPYEKRLVFDFVLTKDIR